MKFENFRVGVKQTGAVEYTTYFGYLVSNFVDVQILLLIVNVRF